MIASKVICDDTYSNQSWGIVAQKMFALKEINQMEREMCGYLEWNLNVAGEEVMDFEAKTRSEHGPRAIARASSSSSSLSSCSHLEPISMPSPAAAYPTPETTPDPQGRPIRPVPSPYKQKSYRSSNASTHAAVVAAAAAALPSPPQSPHHYLRAPNHDFASPSEPPHFSNSTSSSLASSPASDDCKTPSPVVSATSRPLNSKQANYESSRQRQHAMNISVAGLPLNVGAW
jgi:hypothetical protein